MAYMNFPEVWESRVREKLTSLDEAPWLDGIEELPSPVEVMGEGTAGEQNIVHIPIADLDPVVLINNTTYPLAVVEYSDTGTIVALDKYQTEVTTVPDDAVVGASYDRVDVTTRAHIRNIASKKYMKAIHALAPNTNSQWTPILTASGAPDASGRATLIYADLVAAKRACDDIDMPEAGRRMVLCTDHWNDLLLDRDRFGNLLIDYNGGKVSKIIAGFELYQYLGNPYFNAASKTKLPFGGVPSADVRKASVMFYAPRMAKKTGMTKQYYLASELNPRNQANELNFRHYFIVSPVEQKFIGAIV